MRMVHYLDEEKNQRVILDTKTDEKLYDVGDRAGTGRDYDSTRGTCLYVHKSKLQETKTFYNLHWTRWQGEENRIQVLSPEEARAQAEGWLQYLDEDEIKRLVELGILSLEETV